MTAPPWYHVDQQSPPIGELVCVWELDAQWYAIARVRELHIANHHFIVFTDKDGAAFRVKHWTYLPIERPQ